MTWEIFKIHHSTDEIDLLDEDGWWLLDWEPQITQLEDGGVWADNKATGGRQPAFGVYGNAVETLAVGLSGPTKGAVDTQIGRMLDKLSDAFFYWVPGSKLRDAVYLEVKEEEWTGSRYAPLCHGEFPNLPEIQRGNYETGVLVNGRNKVVGISTMELRLERKDWSDQPPGQGECVETDDTFEWIYNAQVVSVYAATRRITAGLYHASTGDMYVAEAGLATPTNSTIRIIKSTDDGVAWSPTTLTLPFKTGLLIYDFLELSNGWILGAGPQVAIRSDDNGATWDDVSNLSMQLWHMIQTTSGRILGAGSSINPPVGGVSGGMVFKSDDNGLTWSQCNFGFAPNSVVIGTHTSLIQDANDFIYSFHFNSLLGILVWRSVNDGDTWQQVGTIPFGTTLPAAGYVIYSIIYGTDLLAFVGDSIYRSQDDGETWESIYFGPPYVSDPINVSGTLYFNRRTGSNPSLSKSTDGGETWQLISSRTGDTSFTIYVNMYNSNIDAVFSAIESMHLYKLEGGTGLQLGHESTCLNEVMVGNKNVLSNLTHVKISDAGVFTNLFPASSFPFAFMPSTIANNDAVYFGCNVNVINSGPFDNIVFNIGEASLGAMVINWEYWNGSTWASLTVSDETNGFGVTGVSIVAFTKPSNWTTNVIDGIEAFWVRARASDVVGTITAPTQDVRDMYSIVRSGININDDQISGRLPSTARIRLDNRSDGDGPLGDGPYLYANRIVCGLHTRLDSDQFVSFINLSSEQNIVGLGISIGVNVNFGQAPAAPTGEYTYYTPAGIEDMEDRVVISLGPDVVQSFYGSFHAYLRGKRTGGLESDVKVRLEIISGTGGISQQTTSRKFKSELDFEVLDLGEVTMPVARSFGPAEFSDETKIKIQANAADSGAVIRFYDLILIPTDEWSGNFVDTSNNGYSEIGRSNDVGKLLDIDSISNPREDIEARVRQSIQNLITSKYNTASVGPAMLQPNQQQSLWFFAMQTSAIGNDFVWVAPPEITHSIQVFYSSRYRSILS